MTNVVTAAYLTRMQRPGSPRYGSGALKPGRLVVHSHPPVRDSAFETIERKGIGHPDTICDNLAAEISRAYARFTTEHFGGLILHHQIDKLMLIGGREKVYFGGSEQLDPITIVLAGRATDSFAGELVPVDDIVRSAIRQFFEMNFPLINFDSDIRIDNRLSTYPGPGTITTSSGAISRMFTPSRREEVRGYESYVANDTSCCVYYLPLSPLEVCVLELEKLLSSADFRRHHAWLGTDIKIMAVRDHDETAITVCIPQIALYVRSLNDYWDNLDNIFVIIEEFLKTKCPELRFELFINTKDDYERFNVYLTRAGASFSGDIGVVGRGNRLNGLITPNRPMTIEAPHGKNPRYYSGFIYSMLAKQLATDIFTQLSLPCVVEIVSQNGAPLMDPWRTRVVCEADRELIGTLHRAALDKVPLITERFLSDGMDV